MKIEQLYQKANAEWQHTVKMRHQYPTFDYYWHERYERVYDISYRTCLNKNINVH